MTPEQALQVVANLASAANATKMQHIQGDQALEVLFKFIKQSSEQVKTVELKDSTKQ